MKRILSKSEEQKINFEQLKLENETKDLLNEVYIYIIHTMHIYNNYVYVLYWELYLYTLAIAVIYTYHMCL